MQLPTVKIRNKTTGQTKIINQTKYADDLAAYSGWEIISMRRGEATDAFVEIERAQERVETARMRNPNSPASKDAQLAFEARSGITSMTDAPPVNDAPFATELTSTVTIDPEPEVETREVAVIGGTHTVKISTRGRKPKSNKDEGDVL